MHGRDLAGVTWSKAWEIKNKSACAEPCANFGLVFAACFVMGVGTCPKSSTVAWGLQTKKDSLPACFCVPASAVLYQRAPYHGAGLL